tara:strand:- start:2433 stop:3455 length:1023 start_codon:yes stop_codon:yes gene_type:complete
MFNPPEGTNDDIYLHVLSYIAGFFNSTKALYLIAALVYGFFYIGSMYNVYRYIKVNLSSRILFMLFTALIFWKSFEGINAIRNWTGAWCLFYGFSSYVLHKKKKFLTFMILSPFIHFGYIIISLPLYVSLVIPKKRYLFYVFLIASFFIKVPLEYIGDAFSYSELGEKKVNVYQQDDERISKKREEFLAKASFHKAYAIDLATIYFEILMVVLLIYLERNFEYAKVKRYLYFSNVACLLIGFSNISYNIPSLSKRLELNALFYVLAFICLSYSYLKDKSFNLKNFNLFFVIGTPIYFLFLFMQLSYITEFANLYLFISPFISFVFGDEMLSIKYFIKEFF